MKKIIVLTCLLTIVLTTAVFPSSDPFESKEPLTMELEAVPITTVLNMIAQQNHLNLVISGNVTGDVTLRLENVDIASALNAILSPNGYNYYIKDNIIIVKPVDMMAVGEKTSEVVTLRYAEPYTIKEALDVYKTAKGEIVILNKSEDDSSDDNKYNANRIMIMDLPEAVQEMMSLVEKLDVPERLISIEVKIIETKVDAKDKIGIAWPTEIAASLGEGTLNSTESSSDESSSSTSSTTLEDIAGNYNPQNGEWTWGTLSIFEVQATLNLLKQNGNSKLLSDPHIITVENHEAEIKVETVIPIPTINRFTEGAATQDILTFYDEEVGISLKVTPRINDDGRITLDVHPKIEDIIGYSGTADNQKPITASRSIRTRISVNNGETVALGGLLEENEIITENKVPLLGSIPILGKFLFTNKSKEKSTTDH